MSRPQRLLIVDDEPMIRMMLADALEEEGYNVLEAANVLEAVGIVGLHDLDAVITDIDMPGGLSGLDLVAMLAQCHPSLPVIVTSGGHALSNDCLPSTATFVSKPYSLGRILCLAQSMIGVGLGTEAPSTRYLANQC